LVTKAVGLVGVVDAATTALRILLERVGVVEVVVAEAVCVPQPVHHSSFCATLQPPMQEHYWQPSVSNEN
jgi:hypothetical protein